MAEDGSATDELEGEIAGELPGSEGIHRLLVRELGGELADAFARTRSAQESWERERRPAEGLRERKKRLTRQHISDVATTLFVVRGFDNVKVSEVAEVVGVSEKTVFNYFPTKEAMVFDEVDEGVERLAVALREREPGESPTRAVLRALKQDLERDAAMADELVHFFLPSFAEMIANTPSLRAAWLDMLGRLMTVATEELAARAEVDPRDPEPMIAARALVGLLDVAFEARVRYTEAGLRGREWREAVLADVERAGRLLETGLWSFHLLTQGARTRQQLQEAAKAAEQARAQVLDALKHARAAWQEMRREERQETKRLSREAAHVERGKAERTAARVGRAAWRSARKTQKSLLEAHAAAERTSYESFRQTLRERQQTIREQQTATRAADRAARR